MGGNCVLLLFVPPAPSAVPECMMRERLQEVLGQGTSVSCTVPQTASVLQQHEGCVCMSVGPLGVGRLQQRAHCPCPTSQPHLQVEEAGDPAEPRRTEKAKDVPVVRPPGALGAGRASHLLGVSLLLQDSGAAPGPSVRVWTVGWGEGPRRSGVPGVGRVTGWVGAFRVTDRGQLEGEEWPSVRGGAQRG